MTAPAATPPPAAELAPAAEPAFGTVTHLSRDAAIGTGGPGDFLGSGPTRAIRWDLRTGAARVAAEAHLLDYSVEVRRLLQLLPSAGTQAS